MIIGFDAKRAFHNYSGLGNYSRSLISALSKYFPEDELVLFTPGKGDLFPDAPENAKIVSPKIAPSLWRTFLLGRNMKKFNLDLFHGLSNELPHAIPVDKIKSVVSIHDVLFKRYPSFYPASDRKIYDWKTSIACKQADCIIVISEQTKNDLIHFYNVDQNEIKVIYQSCDPSYYTETDDLEKKRVNEKYQLPSIYILTVGSLTERKNQAVLIKTLVHLDDEIHLVIVGKGKLKNMLMQTADSLKVNHRLHILDSVGNEDLPAIYQQAEVFVYPSLFEGFGIPILEAVVSGIPVITGKNSCFPEVAGPYSIYVDQENEEEIANAIYSLINDENKRNEIAGSSLKFADKFSSEKVTAKLHDLYERVSEGNKKMR